jgi:hypothetical protein
MKRDEKAIITRLKYTNLRNHAHEEYHDEFNLLVNKYGGASALGILAPYNAYKSWYDKEVEAIGQVRASNFTFEIERQDHARDRLFSGFAGTARAALRHFDPDKRRAARKLKILLDYHGNLSCKPIDAETAAIRSLSRDAREPGYLEAVTALGLLPWLAELEEANLALEALVMSRVHEAAQRPAVPARAARLAVDRCFRGVLDLLEALARAGGANGDFIQELNAVSTRYKNILAQATGRRHPVRDLSASGRVVVEPIDVQRYTGWAITPIPRAFYRQEGEPAAGLVFARDFSVSYKNNVEAGMAGVTLHGTGNYKGKISITFHITR